MNASSEAFFRAIEDTWPAAEVWDEPPFRFRDGQGGGKRVSAATAMGPVSDPAVAAAEARMPAPLFAIRPEDGDLDRALVARGYGKLDPTLIYHCPVERLATPPPRVSAFTVWPPLAIADEIWEAQGIGAARRAVMARARCPKCCLFARTDDQPSGVGFAGLSEGIVMVHALEVRPAFRRKGAARFMMQAAALWGQARGAERIAVLVTEANAGARALYAALGMEAMQGYHYRAPQNGTE